MYTRISIHAPREGSDLTEQRKDYEAQLFQSTLPVRGATQFTARFNSAIIFQSTLPVRGATSE